MIKTHANNQVEILANCGLHRTSNLLQPARLLRVRINGHEMPYWAELLSATGGFAELSAAIAAAPLDMLSEREIQLMIGRDG